MPFYQSIAPWYDHIFPPSPAQLSFIAAQTGSLAGKRILEAGCGTGNLASALAVKGAQIKAIDLDDEMISRAREKNVVPGVTFQKGDILNLQSLFEPEWFHAVVSFGNTLVHLQDTGQVAVFFKQAASVLKPGGKLLIQIINYDHVIEDGLEGLPTIENDTIRFERSYDVRGYDEPIDFRTILTVKATGRQIKNVVKLFPLRRHHIEALLPACGFGPPEFYGNFKADPLSPLSVPLIFVAAKA